MHEESVSTILEAESHTEETRSFIKQVRRITRRKFTPEEEMLRALTLELQHNTIVIDGQNDVATRV